MSINIGNVYNKSTHHGILVYVGRASSFTKAPQGSVNFSILGNPFFMKDESKREEVCKAYSVWLRANYSKGGAIYNAVHDILERSRICELTLLCFCHPKACHADELSTFINEVNNS